MNPRTPLLAFLCLLCAACESTRKDDPGPAPSKNVSAETNRPGEHPRPLSPHPTREEAWFGFADSTGTRLICPTPDTLPEGPYFLASLSGDLAPLKYLGHQSASAQWDRRATARNFSFVGGHLFSVRDSGLESDRTYLVVTKRFLDSHHPVPASAGDCQELGTNIPSLAWATKERRIRTAWNLASLPNGYIATLVYVGAPPLAALVVARGDSSLRENFRGVASGDSSSTWRVDDGGVFDGCNLKALAVFSSTKGTEIAYAWGAFEGEGAALLQPSADTFTVEASGFRYWSP